jgi:hypothetical protein
MHGFDSVTGCSGKIIENHHKAWREHLEETGIHRRWRKFRDGRPGARDHSGSWRGKSLNWRLSQMQMTSRFIDGLRDGR